MYEISICSNVETICDGYMPLESSDQDDAAAVFTQAATKSVMEDDRYPSEVYDRYDSNFRNWHGGRHDQFRVRVACFVSVGKNAPQWVKQLAITANDAGVAALKEFADQCRANDLAYAIENESDDPEMATAIREMWTY